MQRITPCLWFDDQAEEATKFYVSVFKNSKIRTYDPLWRSRRKGLRETKGIDHDRDVEIVGQEFMALNGGPHFTFSEAISLMVQCETQRK